MEKRRTINDADRRYRLVKRYVSAQLMLENVDAAADLIDELRDAAGATGDMTNIASATNEVGSVYLSLDRIPEAIDAAQRALTLLPQDAPAGKRALFLF